MEFSNLVGKAVLGNGRELDTCVFTCLYEGSRFFKGDVNGFFNDDMQSCPRSLDADLGMKSARHAHGNRIYSCKELLNSLERGDSKLGGGLFCAFVDDIKNTHKVGTFDVLERFTVDTMYGTATNYSVLNH